MNARRPPVGLCLITVATALFSSACQDAQVAEIPNRVLDRPTDAALVCASVICDDEDGDGFDDPGECHMQAEPLSLCSSEIGTCASRVPHLVGFVANSERNEIAMFTKCDNRLVDMSPEVPGYNFMPAGILPTELDASEDGCRVISTNVGSCDLNVLDAPALAGFGIELPESDRADELSSLISTLIPERFNDSNDPDDPYAGRWVPLGARPGQILAVPNTLTTAPGLDPNQALEDLCDPLARASAYVSFPTCNLVAEVDLQTGRILQSRKFVPDGSGGILVEDTGVTPTCPAECPAQFTEGVPGDLPQVDAEGAFPQALELALQPEANDPDIEGQELYVGGLGSDILFEIPIADSGTWTTETKQLELDQAGGIKGIRISPKVEIDNDSDAQTYRFIYAITGDGSTRVVGRTLPKTDDEVGVECETQLDPSLVDAGIPSYCPPVTQTPNEGQPAERRGFSRGPGIRPGRGEEVTDWMFIQTDPTSDDSTDSLLSGSPFEEPGTVAVGVTNGGFGIYVMVDQSRGEGATSPGDLLGTGGDQTNPADPAGVMDVRLFSHALWPQSNNALGLPLVLDEVPGRTTPSGHGATRTLAPTLRRIDAAYAEDEAAQASYGIEDIDQLRTFYGENVARVAVHDYRSWGSSGGSRWSLEWEGTIQGTQSSTGRIYCENPGWEGGTCLLDNKQDTRLLDSGADFCDDGVLAGDKLVLVGCREDDDCGDGRRCLRESTAGGQSSGICVSADAYDSGAADLRQKCEGFISDPCGEAIREYTITRAFQDELWIQSMDQPLISYTREYDPESGCPVNSALAGDGECICLDGFSVEACGGADEGCCPIPGAVLSSQAPIVELEGRFVCTDTQPDAGCTIDADCEEGMCIDSRCRRECGPEEDCIARRLPGPECFGEFVRYQVALRDSFRVSGPGINFVTDLVDIVTAPEPDEILDEVSKPDSPQDPADPAWADYLAYIANLEMQTAAGKLECLPTTNGDISRLLTSRLPLPSSDDPDDPEWLAIPVCADSIVGPGEANPCRIAQPRSSASLFHTFEYEGVATVSALRFSNPIFSIVLDLSSLEALVNEVPGYEDSLWPYSATEFHRSRIPRGYRQEFGLDSGYLAFGERIILGGRAVTYPVRILAAPQANVAYVVDGSGPGSSTGIRGQVVRVTLGAQITADIAFDGVR